MPKRARRPKQATVNISMPAPLRAEVEEHVREGGFGNVSEYFRHLVRRDMERVEEGRRRLRAMLDEGERSGPPILADEKFWERLRSTARSAGQRGRRRAG